MNDNATVAKIPAIAEGDIVTILGDNRFTGRQGLVIDIESDLRPQDGPIAVFFDEEVPDHEFYDPPWQRRQWSDTVPNKSNYRECCRVKCFPANELKKDMEFLIDSVVRRKFGSNFNIINSWKFPLRPGTHACQFEACTSGQLATKLTLANIWGTIQTVYSCEACHKEWHGVRVDEVKLKNPLPGA